jgi:hypothetical protein
MQDTISLLYIAACLGGVWLANRAPVAIPRTFQIGTVMCRPDLRPFQFMTTVFLLAGAGLGVTLPSTIAFILWGNVATTGNAALHRLTMVIGGVCGVYIGARAVWLWTVLMLAGFGLWVLGWILGFEGGQ